jgi:hypothetical protein
MGMKGFILGLILGLLIVGCAGAVFPYRFYGLQDVDYSKGKLLGDKPENDLLFIACEPSEKSKNPCVVMKAEEFFTLKKDHLDLQEKLIDCQKEMRFKNGSP